MFRIVHVSKDAGWQGGLRMARRLECFESTRQPAQSIKALGLDSDDAACPASPPALGLDSDDAACPASPPALGLDSADAAHGVHEHALHQLHPSAWLGLRCCIGDDGTMLMASHRYALEESMEARTDLSVLSPSLPPCFLVRTKYAPMLTRYTQSARAVRPSGRT
jgi:hypothetical protein